MVYEGNPKVLRAPGPRIKDFERFLLFNSQYKLFQIQNKYFSKCTLIIFFNRESQNKKVTLKVRDNYGGKINFKVNKKQSIKKLVCLVWFLKFTVFINIIKFFMNYKLY